MTTKPAIGDSSTRNTQDAQFAGGVITGVQGLAAALKSGQPLPIANSFFSLAAHLNGGKNEAVNDISAGLGLVSSIIGFRDALKNGDNFGILVSAGNLSKNALGIYQGYLSNQIAAQGGQAALQSTIDYGSDAAAQAASELLADSAAASNLAANLGQTLVAGFTSVTATPMLAANERWYRLLG
jgi:hypothetical protein